MTQSVSSIKVISVDTVDVPTVLQQCTPWRTPLRRTKKRVLTESRLNIISTSYDRKICVVPLFSPFFCVTLYIVVNLRLINFQCCPRLNRSNSNGCYSVATCLTYLKFQDIVCICITQILSKQEHDTLNTDVKINIDATLPVLGSFTRVGSLHII